MSIIAAGTTTTTALSSTGNTDGTLQFQVNGTTPSVTLNTLGAIGVGSTPGYGSSGQVLTSAGSTAAPTWSTNVSSQWTTTGSDIYYNTGNVGIGGTAAAFVKQQILGTYPTSSNVTQVVRASGTIPSGSTTSATIFQSIPTTEASAFTLGNLYHFSADQQALGASSAVTTQIGFAANSTLTGATNNYGFYGGIASGTGRYNLYMAGTAQNYFAGDVITNGKIGLGTAGSPSYGTSGQVLTSGGSGAAPTWSTPAAGGFSNMAVFTGSGTWTIPSGVTKCKVTVTGAGGGGGNYAGGSGGTAISVVTLSGSTATITVGSGGSSTGSGYAGTSSFVNGSTTITAYGGQNGNTGSGYAPTSGGYATGGDINISGAGGSTANNGAGAGSYWGGGGGSGSGAYGSGGASSASYYSSQAGNSGIVVIEY